MDELSHSQLLVDSLLQSSLLVDQLGEFSAFDRTQLDSVTLLQPLNFQQKLGHLYEDALKVILEQSSGYELISNSVQIFRNRENGARDTLGELDYLLRLPNGEVVQLELAVKFYLAVPNAEKIAHWPGPDARDHWDKKRLRMQDHQFQVGKCDEAKALLLEKFSIDRFEIEHLIYGCLFDHAALPKSEANAVSEHCNRGIWFRRDEWNAYAPDASIWYVPKHLWPVDPSKRLVEQIERTDKEQMLELSRERCAMFTDGYKRYFIVSDQWCQMTDLE